MAADPLSQVFAALADPLRRDLVARLASGDATVGALAAPYDVSPQAVSKHLRVLEEAGLVSRRREAQRRPAHLETEVLDLMTMWIERNRREAEFRYRRLDDVLLGEGELRPEGGGASASAVRPAPPSAPARPAAPAPAPAAPPAVGDVVEPDPDAAPGPRVRTQRTLRFRMDGERVFQPWDLGARVVIPDDDTADDTADDPAGDPDRDTGGGGADRPPRP
ncbi:helix-turn-helix transcriptional regulator [Cellulomonas sp. PS-H5]|uniref:ArsR/SmtB family transcription factor n=1 Tax=Cellulomonas sp. PS-H5 TaxID=2820400 RepID=UPI001C4FA8B8|nr:metalloregulator ArsR/SmtB family transcription factor [Cellulomonas sp. PS-H5]MBW0252983.1 metalloregulator ArsR/SmtB family transcription factor [Cellulomonas sp. PS-H5]